MKNWLKQDSGFSNRFVIMLVILSSVSANISRELFMPKDACAGSNFTELAKTTEIVDWDKWVKAKAEAEEYAKKQGAMIFTHSEVVE